ncbi:MAG TPA: hypothetical protein VGO62_19350, partial [Myxococcota bacterium]
MHVLAFTVALASAPAATVITGPTLLTQPRVVDVGAGAFALVAYADAPAVSPLGEVRLFHGASRGALIMQGRSPALARAGDGFLVVLLADEPTRGTYLVHVDAHDKPAAAVRLGDANDKHNPV